MAVLRRLTLLVVAAFMPLIAAAEPISCHIGKPSYCFKYGGSLCESWNTQQDAPSACAKWTAACIDCHNEIPECLGHHRPDAESPLCLTCAQSWRACMARIDARYWPNRMSGHQ